MCVHKGDYEVDWPKSQIIFHALVLLAISLLEQVL